MISENIGYENPCFLVLVFLLQKCYDTVNWKASRGLSVGRRLARRWFNRAQDNELVIEANQVAVVFIMVKERSFKFFVVFCF
jgi:hypothetical protein